MTLRSMFLRFMNSSLLVNGRLGCLLFLIGSVSGTMPVALSAAGAPGVPGGAETADDTSNPYSVIVERNIFHLSPPPPPPEAEKPKVELPVIKITGFVNIGSTSKVLFLSEPKDKKEGPFYYSLAEGEKSSDGRFELVRIHPAQDEVDVINDGVPVTLTVKDDSLGSSPAPAASSGEGERPATGNPRSGMPGRPMFPPRRGSPPGFSGLPGAGNGFSFPARARRNVPQ
jgi:hypothetical protein